ncbi:MULTISPECIES: ATP-dependent DNA ligase [Sphingobacterium]|uniref:ATP-dependent DNA ligase n=1 Tax=Sphingobacterium TaxID=28453 RepID=UPI00104B0209|nr:MULTISPECIES: ATP-dependent DNA ligase [Sphingobacterium]MCW2259390.1 DNA ligase-1 [Sphingobacterium kitahiroshimense]NJI72508.1 ATP-dependent DNA ligase [Sphingobacterium sp. B16(2022)]QQD12497.1 ATP-dependent DNA ligase [Sphingobacterium sp. UDSM-2020]TCR14162.1 DNA ligase-1 [Sphingobacterium sp. JUb78]
MRKFSRLISRLEQSNKTNDKLTALVDYFSEAEDADKIWVIALFTGKKPKRTISTNLLKEWITEITGLPTWLFVESYHNVGDLSETIALLLPPSTSTSDIPLHQWILALKNLSDSSNEDKKEFVFNAWEKLSTQERFVFNKLISGNFRIGISSKNLIHALAKLSGLDTNHITHSIMGKWDPEKISFGDLIGGLHVNTDSSWPYPFCLAYPIDVPVHELGSVDNWQAEWKWDGIRGQIIKRNDELFIWSRGEELVTDQFPELHVALSGLPNGTVIDGEILAVREGEVLSFSTLQQRLNRKTINKKQLDEAPVAFYAYDVLEYGGMDYRAEPLHKRRAVLEKLLPIAETILTAPIVPFDSWENLVVERKKSRELNSEGIMLKRQDSLYHSGRKRGDWWKWKIEPFTIDVVMIYAQKGSGRRANFFTDYTFAVRDGDQFITIAKAYSGLTDKEIKEVNSFVVKNAIEKFGPVRTVKPELVFEIAFEGIAVSKRHKAGLALRFPRIVRWRRDKKVDDINTLEDLQILLESTMRDSER